MAHLKKPIFHQKSKNAWYLPCISYINNLKILFETKLKRNKQNEPISNAVVQKTDGKYNLNPNHTHFVLVDDGSGFNSEYGQEIEFRTRLEVALMNKRNINDKSGVYVVSGGPNTLLTIAKALFESINVTVFEVHPF